MIRVRIPRDLAARLAQKAARLASAHAEARQRAARDGHSHWRRAALLWPLFPKG